MRCSYKTLWKFAGTIFGLVVGGVLMERIAWEEIPDVIFYPIISILIVIALILYIIGYRLAKHQRPKTGKNRKVISILWEMYKIEQKLVEKRGKQGLNQQQLFEVKRKGQQQLKVPTIHISHKLPDDEAIKIILYMQKKMKVKMKNEFNFNKHTLKSIILFSNILDDSNVGIKSLLIGNTRYKALKNKSKDARITGGIRSVDVKRTREYSATLNSTLLSYLYFKPDYDDAIENSEFPYDEFVDSLDDMMIEKLNCLGN